MVEITLEEPLYGYKQEVAMIPTGKLKVIEIQRAASKAHIKRLSDSIRRVGFVVPLVVVRRGGRKHHNRWAAQVLGCEGTGDKEASNDHNS